jgi:predicted outer membrane repeat protein
LVSNWLRPTPRHDSRRRTLARGYRPTFRPRLEVLEDRTVPSTFFVTNLLDAGAGSLRQAVLNAEQSSGADQINFSVTGTITLTSGQLNVSEALTINGPGRDTLTISGNINSRIFDVTGGPFRVTGVTLADGRAFGANGGAIRAQGPGATVSVDGARFLNNLATGNGGAIDTPGNTVNIANSLFEQNTAFGSGGALSVGGNPTVTITNTIFDGNFSENTGGAINSNTSATFNITDTTFVDNSARSLGGAIATVSTLTVTRGRFVNNIAIGSFPSDDALGGAIWSENTSTPFTTTIIDSTFNANRAQGADGGFDGEVLLVDGTDGLGGAIFSDGLSSLSISGSTFSNNQAVAGDGTVSGSEVGIAGNASGGAIFFNGSTPNQTLNVLNSTFSANQVFAGTDQAPGLGTADGGAVAHLGSGIATFTSSTIVFNEANKDFAAADTRGGGIASLGSNPVRVRNTILSRNVANTRNGTGGSFFGPDVFGDFTSLGYNLVFLTFDSTGFTAGQNNDVLFVTPNLTPLQDNGGPTQTHAPTGSNFFLLGGGDPSLAGTLDQRSVVRGVNVEIGAVDVTVDATQLTLTAPATVTAGQFFSFTVTARDEFGNLAIDYAGTVRVSSNVGILQFPFTPSDRGQVTLSQAFIQAGLQPILARDIDNPALTATTNVLVNPGPAASLIVTPLPPNVNAGAPVSFTVTARDDFGNVATGYTGTVTFSSTDPRAILPAPYTFTAQDAGVHTFSVTFGTLGPQTLTLSDPSRELFTAVDFNVRPGAAVAFTFTPLPANLTAGTPASFTVTARDVFGNIATGYTGTVTFSSTDPQATLPASYTFSAQDAGVHTFSATFRTAGPQSLTVRDAGNASLTATTNTTVGAAQAVGFALQAPESVNQGTPFNVTVRAVDAFGNTVTGFAGTTSVTSSDPFATLPGPLAFTPADGGVLTFTAILRSVGPATLTITGQENPALQGTAGVAVLNVAPSAVALQLDRTTTPEGGSVVLTGSFADPGTGEAHTVLVLWGDGTSEAVTLQPGVFTFTLGHTFADDRSLISPDPLKTISVVVTDASAATATATTQVQVENVAPILTAIDEVRLTEGDALDVTPSATDPGADALTALVDFGDGSGIVGVEVGADGSIVLQHPYAVEGSFQVTVTVIDDDGGQAVQTFFVQVLLPGINLIDVQTGEADPGEQVTVSSTGVTATLFNNGDERAGILVAAVAPAVADGLDGDFVLTTAGAEGEVIAASFDVRAFNVSGNDVAVVTFRYSGDGPPTLRFFDRASGTYKPFVGTLSVNEAEKTITIVLDSTSTPTLQATSGTVFTISVPAAQPVSPAPIPIPLFALGRGGTGETALARLDTGVDSRGGTALDGAGIGTGAEGRSAASGGRGEGNEEGSRGAEEREEPLSDLPESEPVEAPPLTATVSPSQPDAPGSEPAPPAEEGPKGAGDEEAPPPVTEEEPATPSGETLQTAEPPLPEGAEGPEGPVRSALDALFSDVPEDAREGNAAPLLGAVTAGAWWMHRERRRHRTRARSEPEA